jgi:carbamoyl-phosphate synthase small subunit
MKVNRAILALADGTVFEGRSFGAEGESTGEVVFNTSLTGYQEILTDPSYRGQMVTMTYPHIGNYGANEEDMESSRPYAEGLIVKEFCRHPSNWRSSMGLDDLMVRYGIVGIEGIDTRALTKHIRDSGEQAGIISTIDLDPRRLVKRAYEAPGLIGRDLAKEVTCTSPYPYKLSQHLRPNESEDLASPVRAQGQTSGSAGDWLGHGGIASKAEQAPIADRLGASEDQHLASPHGPPQFKVIAYDFGIKQNILRMLAGAGCEVTIVPAAFPAEEAMSMHPDGVLLSNGPGDPAALTYAVQNTRKLLGKIPIFGICLGHQLLGLALGGSTYKLKFGHHGGNHPVKDLSTGEVKITTQNHGFAVVFEKPETLFGPVEITHRSLNDQTVEGMRCLSVPAFSVQYHPESSPGPHDAGYLFKQFVNMMESH